MRERLVEYRNGFSDEIPDQIVSGRSPELLKKTKVRLHWWQGVIGVLANGLTQGEIRKPEVHREVEEFLAYYTSDEFEKRQSRDELHDRPLITNKDIKRANRTINLVLDEK